mmetsp:Transcript_45262/g.113854  ORF Transcript_45262/g.113854 Transcript_45262/m.113854 type:complete len:217 (+) Transcript_45262:54-704(+)
MGTMKPLTIVIVILVCLARSQGDIDITFDECASASDDASLCALNLLQHRTQMLIAFPPCKVDPATAGTLCKFDACKFREALHRHELFIKVFKAIDNSPLSESKAWNLTSGLCKHLEELGPAGATALQQQAAGIEQQKDVSFKELCSTGMLKACQEEGLWRPGGHLHWCSPGVVRSFYAKLPLLNKCVDEGACCDALIEDLSPSKPDNIMFFTEVTG